MNKVFSSHWPRSAVNLCLLRHVRIASFHCKRCNLIALLIEKDVKMFQANYSLFDSALHFFRPCHVCRWVSVSYSTAGIKNLPNHANLRMHPSRFLLWRSVTPEKTQQNGKDSIIIFQTSSTRTFKNLWHQRQMQWSIWNVVVHWLLKQALWNGL